MNQDSSYSTQSTHSQSLQILDNPSKSRLNNKRIYTIKSNDLKNENLDKFLKELSMNKSITTMIIKHNIKSDLLRKILNTLENKMNFESISLNNLITNKKKLTIVQNFLSQSKSIKTISLKYNKLYKLNEYYHILGLGFKLSNTIKEIDLSFNKIDSFGIEKFFSFISTSQFSLSKLDISYNPIGNKGAKLLFLYLCNKNVNIKELFLVGCEISDEIGYFLSSFIKINSSILILNMDKNYIGEFVIRHLIHGLLRNNTISFITLRTQYKTNPSLTLQLYKVLLKKSNIKKLKIGCSVCDIVYKDKSNRISY